MNLRLPGFLSCIIFAIISQAQVAVTKLECEHLINPLGIDEPHPRLTWQINDHRNGAKQLAYQVIVSKDSMQLIKKIPVAWNSGRIKSDSMMVRYKGKELEPFTKYYWTVMTWDEKEKMTTSSVAGFETGMMNEQSWRGDWISDGYKGDLNKPAGCFRKLFSVDKPITSARIYIAVAGLYELYLNGKRIGNHVLDPVFTRYDRRNLYVTYDVTADLSNGNNVIGVLLGNGWYNMKSNTAWLFNEAPWRNRPIFCLDLRITYSDGTFQTVESRSNWKTSFSPIAFNNVYVGEHVDARKNIFDWLSLDFDDKRWNNARLRSAPSGNIVSQALQPIREIEKITAVSMKKFNDTDYVFTMTKNLAGISEITVIGEKGTVIKLTHAEQTDSTGHVDQTGISQHYRDVEPFQADVYILSGKMQTLRPRFNYKGFQHVEVTSNKPIQLVQKSVVAYAWHSDVPTVGTMQSSNELINKIWAATNNSYLSNLMGYPTDCPQREKNGWTGDAHIAIETGLYNFDAITIYEKWMADFRDAQSPDGRIPSIIPTGDVWGYDNHNGPDWVSAIAIIPWELYQFYGDIKPLADNYEAIKSYVNLLERKYPNGLCNWGLGDWVPIKSFAPKQFTSTVYYYIDALILSKTAKLLNRQNDEIYFAKLARHIKNAFNNEYLDTLTGNYDQGLQTELSAALYWKLVPDHLIKKTADILSQNVINNGRKLDVGLLGSKTILNALSENGYADLAFELAASDQYPSWGYWIANGATTLYEGWETGKKLPFSLNHIMFGEISAWFYKALGGIKPDPEQPGFKNVILEPHFVKGLGSFYCYHDGPYGKIISSWKRQGNNILYDIVIPPNSTGTLFINKKIQKLNSGSYHFTLSK